jgi:hypothetical protein
MAMIGCNKIRRLLCLSTAGDLDEAAARRVRLHLVGCVPCRQAAREVIQSQGALELVRQSAGSAGHQSLWPELSVRIARLRQDPGGLSGWIPVGALAAACLAVYIWGSTAWLGSVPEPEVRLSQTAGRSADEVADLPPTEEPVWLGPSRPRPVLPDAHPVTLRSRQF